jgi:aspartyl-tRNA(Asn)/glutamyl-tRNA(Gln) amidotransferase subunit A
MARALRAGQVSARELVERTLRAIDAWQPSINAFSQVWDEEALAQADQVKATDERPFAGVPVAVKDLYDVAGHETTACSSAYAGNLVKEDATTIAGLRQAGLIFVGKTNQHELAAGGTNAVSACGPVRNPWDPRRVSGGSSGGSGAALAAGIVPWTLGSDTGGSIRIPGSFCGTFGLKPTLGRISTQGMLPLGPSLDTPGPMASYAEDLEPLHEMLMGISPHLTPRPEPHVRGLRIGVPDGYFVDKVHPEIVAGVRAVAEQLAQAGAQVESTDGRGIEDARAMWMRITYSEFDRAHPLPAERRNLIHPSVRNWMELGRRFSAEEKAAAYQRQSEIRQWFEQKLERYDVLLVPSTAYWAPRLGQTEIDQGAAGTISMLDVGPGWLSCTTNLSGHPTVSLPAGRTLDGMPFGVSAIGRNLDEERLLSLAIAWEQIAGYQAQLAALP